MLANIAEPLNGGTTEDAVPLLPGTKIYVSNLPAGMKEVDFKALFREFGPIVKSSLVKRRRTTTFGFMHFASPDKAQHAITIMNGTTFEGRVLTVQLAESEKDTPPPSRNLRVCNLPNAATQAQVEAIFARFGDVVSCRLERKDGLPVTALIEFAKLPAAVLARSTLHRLRVLDQASHLEVVFLQARPPSPPASRPLLWNGHRQLRSTFPLDAAPTHPVSSSSQACAPPSMSALHTQLQPPTAPADSAEELFHPLAEYIEHMLLHYQQCTRYDDPPEEPTPS